MKHALIPTLLAAGALLLSACAHKEVSLLGGHLTMTLPARAELTDGTSTGQTVYSIGKDTQAIQIWATEMIKFAGPDFVAEATRDMEKYRQRPEYKDHEFGTLRDAIVYLLITRPPAPGYDPDTFRYGMAYVRSADGMVQHIAFRFGSDHAKDIPACRQFMLDALRSIKDGKTPDLNARTVDVAEIGGQKLKLPVPEGYCQTDDEGPDFEVHRFREVRKPGTEGASLMLYLGSYPNLGMVPPLHSSSRKGTLLGQEVKWQIGRNTAPFLSADAITLVPVDMDGDTPALHCFLHVRINADSDEKLEALISAAEGITLTEKDK